MKKQSTISKKVDGAEVVNLFAEIAEKEQKKAKRATKKKAETVAKAEVVEKAEKPVKTTKKATVKKPAEKVEKVVKSQSTKAEKPAEKPKKVVKKTTKKAEKVEQEAKEQELRPLTEIKIAKTEYILDDTIKSYDDLVKAIEAEKEVFVAFDISEVDSKEYENIFHVPHEKSMKERFDICTPIFVGEKNPRLVFASVYTEALWDLFPDEFELLSAVLIEKPKKAKK